MTDEIRVRDLLAHRSGLGSHAGDLLFTPATTYSTREVVERLRSLPLKTGFRDSFAYENIMFAVATLIIEQASGETYGDFVSEHIYDARSGSLFGSIEDELDRSLCRIRLVDGRLQLRFTKSPRLVGSLSPWRDDTFLVRWDDRTLNADAFIDFTVDQNGGVREAHMRRASPRTAHAYDYEDLELVLKSPAGTK